jgi:nitroreductase
MTTLAEAIANRFSCRAYLPTPVRRKEVEDILAHASRAPSGGNLQPWHVDAVAGEALEALTMKARDSLALDPAGEGTEFPIYPSGLPEPWRSRRFANGERLYAALGIAREDRGRRLTQFARNYEMFGAPVGLFFSLDRRFGPPQWAHLGMYMQNVMLLAHERGLATCAQEAWAALHRTVGAFLNLPEERMLYCGMALGRPDLDHPVNRWRSGRVAPDEFATFRGF